MWHCVIMTHWILYHDVVILALYRTPLLPLLIIYHYY